MWLVIRHKRELQVVWIEGETNRKVVAGPFATKPAAIKAARELEDYYEFRALLMLMLSGIVALLLIQALITLG